MLTPEFHLQQTDDFVLLHIKAPYIKANDVQIHIDGQEFKFYVKPYFLRLRFQKELIEDGQETASYDISTGKFDVKLPKRNTGEHFPDLDMLTTLLAPKKSESIKPLIEEVGEATEGDSANDDEDEEFCWEFEQSVFQPSELSLEQKYGFANQTSGVLSRMQNEFHEMIDLPDPDRSPVKERRTLRKNAEMEKFDEDHYAADYFDDDAIQLLINFVTPWQCEYNRTQEKNKNTPQSTPTSTDTAPDQPSEKSHTLTEQKSMKLNEEENYTLLKIPNKNYLLSKEEEQGAWLGLVDILFAYCYNYRTTEGESTSESAWTICKISSTLSWLDSFTNLDDVIMSGYCRCLCYPLYRNMALIDRVFQDVNMIFSLGKLWILRCLLDTRKILLSDENRYVLNDLYITDYIVWIQKQKASRLRSLSDRLGCVQVDKKEIPFNIDVIQQIRIVEEQLTDDDSESDVDSTEESSTDSDDVESVDTPPQVLLRN